MKRYRPYFDETKFSIGEILLHETFRNKKENHTINTKILPYFEAVFRPDTYALLLKKQMLLSIKGISEIDSTDDVKKILNSDFNKYSIYFKISLQSSSNGIGYMETSEKTQNINVWLSSNIKEVIIEESKLFIQVFFELIGHELIHRSQILAKNKYKAFNILDKKKETQIEYFSRKTELMSYAWQLIEELRFQGATDSDILNYIKNPINSNYDPSIYTEIYLTIIKNSKITDQFKKYVYEYIKGDFNKNVIKVKL